MQSGLLCCVLIELKEIVGTCTCVIHKVIYCTLLTKLAASTANGSITLE